MFPIIVKLPGHLLYDLGGFQAIRFVTTPRGGAYLAGIYPGMGGSEPFLASRGENSDARMILALDRIEKGLRFGPPVVDLSDLGEPLSDALMAELGVSVQEPEQPGPPQQEPPGPGGRPWT